MNNNCNVIIDALHKGRELFPKQGHGHLFHDSETACALGAIAVGLGYTPLWENIYSNSRKLHDLPVEFNDQAAYDFILLKLEELGLARTLDYGDIYTVNDDAMAAKKDADEAVIKYIEARCS